MIRVLGKKEYFSLTISAGAVAPMLGTFAIASAIVITLFMLLFF
jgi:hypothetical protein